jgi:streptomycin 6-kinase
MAFALPQNLSAYAERRGRTEWLATLPSTIAAVTERWSLDEIGEPFQPGGQTAWVAPVHSSRIGEAVLKVASRHYEAFDEAKGLREWDGEGAVRLFAAEDIDEATTVLLLERCRPGHSLTAQPAAVQDHVISDLLRRLWREPPLAADFRPLQQMCDQWADECERKLSERPRMADPGLLREGIALFRTLPGSAERDLLLCTDLHADNVLAAEREPWLMIDPKPYVGDPTYDALQHLFNNEDRLADNPHGCIAHLARLLDLDAERLTLWVFARWVVESPDRPELLETARRIAPR